MVATNGKSHKYMCTSCGKNIMTYKEVRKHPALNVLQCITCHSSYNLVGDLSKYRGGVELNGQDNYCRWCLDGGELLLCNDENCRNGFCNSCIERNLGPREIKDITQSQSWYCFICDDSQLKDLRLAADRALRYLKPPIKFKVVRRLPQPEVKSPPKPEIQSKTKSPSKPQIQSKPKSPPILQTQSKPKSPSDPRTQSKPKSPPNSQIQSKPIDPLIPQVQSKPIDPLIPQVQSKPIDPLIPQVQSKPKSPPTPLIQSKPSPPIAQIQPEPKSPPIPQIQPEPKSPPIPQSQSEPKSPPIPQSQSKPKSPPIPQIQPEPKSPPKARPPAKVPSATNFSIFSSSKLFNKPSASSTVKDLKQASPPTKRIDTTLSVKSNFASTTIVAPPKESLPAITITVKPTPTSRSEIIKALDEEMEMSDDSSDCPFVEASDSFLEKDIPMIDSPLKGPISWALKDVANLKKRLQLHVDAVNEAFQTYDEKKFVQDPKNLSSWLSNIESFFSGAHLITGRCRHINDIIMTDTD